MSSGSSGANREHRRARRWRASKVALDQVISGGSNVLTAILAARTLDVTSFGEFGIVFLVFTVGQTIPRALIGQPLLVHPEETDERPGEALGSGVAVGLVTGALVATAGLACIALSAEDLGLALVILGAFFPLLALQDMARFVAFTTRQPEVAVRLDLVWLVLMVVGIIGGNAVTDLGLPGLVFAWVAAGSVAGLLALWEHRGEPKPISFAWVRQRWTFSWRYFVLTVTNQGGTLVATVILAGVAGTAAVGAVQGTLLLMRPFMTAQIASWTSGTTDVARERPDRHELRRFAQRVSALSTSIALVNAVALFLIPTGLGEALLGDTWSSTEELLLPAGISILVMGSRTGPRAALLGARAIHRVLGLDVTLTPITVVISSVGAALNGATGFYWGIIGGQAVMASAWWVSFLRYTGADPPGSNAKPTSSSKAAAASASSG